MCRNFPIPSEVEDCIQKNCPIWKHTEWSECSSSCGKGHKTRNVYCSIEDSNLIQLFSNLSYKFLINNANKMSMNKIIQVPNSKCINLNKPSNITECQNLVECPEWRTGPWTSCSVTCGQGIKVRSVQCITGKSSDCAHLAKPNNSEICILSACSAHWQVGDWSEVRMFNINKMLFF
jgi:a disintegrin and metalloproteinase with thrombospondin motifs 9